MQFGVESAEQIAPHSHACWTVKLPWCFFEPRANAAVIAADVWQEDNVNLVTILVLYAPISTESTAETDGHVKSINVVTTFYGNSGQYTVEAYQCTQGPTSPSPLSPVLPYGSL